MKALLKEFLLIFLVGITSFISIVIIGIVGLPDSVGGKLFVWIIAGLISYLVYIFIPFFDIKKKQYLDGYALASSYLTIIFICLFRSNSIEEYEYITVFGLLSGIPFVAELAKSIFKKKGKKESKNKYNYEELIMNLSIDKEYFSILDVVYQLKISEYKTRLILKEMIAKKLIILKKEGNKNIYSVVQNTFVNH